ncbi:pimeloyl-ACP methyl ester carboxylesterase [Rhodococcus sp. OK519]|uniref:alpha/beta fold hydrolase n=1 Tax=Rhodococcus sp. OK519 TaxID=2135729 RepID=UPI000D3CE350|nr:pimeloyl-ACP methyl ester carboxylesterase [Rhodococcus sp. OK519]
MGQPSSREALEPHRPVRFCTTPTGARVAYACTGQGKALLVPAAWISHLELLWQDPAYRAFFAPLSAIRMVVQYDRPGCGLSDPWPGAQGLDTDLVILEALADHLDLESVDLLGISLGAPVSAAFAARFPQRVGRLILYGGYADGSQIATPEVRTAMLGLVRAHWGLGSELLSDVFLPDGNATTKALFARLQQEAASPDLAVGLLAQCYETDVTDLLARVTAPTLVVHRREDRAMPYRAGRELAAHIPGARLVSLPGSSHFPHVGDASAVVRAILEFLGEGHATPSSEPSTSPSGELTARQLEVAALVAEGMTNRQIAQRLGIEERSAEGHVERIRLRLGFTSRAQVAAWWARHVSSATDSVVPDEVPD